MGIKQLDCDVSLPGLCCLCREAFAHAYRATLSTQPESRRTTHRHLNSALTHLSNCTRPCPPALQPQLKVLAEEARADLHLTDRWGLTPLDEAKRGGAAAAVAYLEELEEGLPPRPEPARVRLMGLEGRGGTLGLRRMAEPLWETGGAV